MPLVGQVGDSNWERERACQWGNQRREQGTGALPASALILGESWEGEGVKEERLRSNSRPGDWEGSCEEEGGKREAASAAPKFGSGADIRTRGGDDDVETRSVRKVQRAIQNRL